MIKPQRWWELCRTKQAYFDAWESGTGPGQQFGVRDDMTSWKPRLSHSPGHRIPFLTLKDLCDASMHLASLLPPDITHVVGVPRSGMIPASIISAVLHLPLGTIVDGHVVDCGSGHRMVGYRPSGFRVAFIDDTLAGGNTKKWLSDCGLLLPPHVYAVVYSADAEAAIHARTLPLPHFLEWNLFNSGYVHEFATDLDGVICHNPPSHAHVLYPSRRTPLEAIITARPADERVRVMRWADEHGIAFKRLLMWPWSLKENNDIARVAAWKVRMARECCVGWYIESEPAIADQMRSLGMRVLCPRQGYLE